MVEAGHPELDGFFAEEFDAALAQFGVAQAQEGPETVAECGGDPDGNPLFRTGALGGDPGGQFGAEAFHGVDLGGGEGVHAGNGVGVAAVERCEGDPVLAVVVVALARFDEGDLLGVELLEEFAGQAAGEVQRGFTVPLEFGVARVDVGARHGRRGGAVGHGVLHGVTEVEEGEDPFHRGEGSPFEEFGEVGVHRRDADAQVRHHDRGVDVDPYDLIVREGQGCLAEGRYGRFSKELRCQGEVLGSLRQGEGCCHRSTQRHGAPFP